MGWTNPTPQGVGFFYAHTPPAVYRSAAAAASPPCTLRLRGARAAPRAPGWGCITEGAEIAIRSGSRGIKPRLPKLPGGRGSSGGIKPPLLTPLFLRGMLGTLNVCAQAGPAGPAFFSRIARLCRAIRCAPAPAANRPARPPPSLAGLVLEPRRLILPCWPAPPASGSPPRACQYFAGGGRRGLPRRDWWGGRGLPAFGDPAVQPLPRSRVFFARPPHQSLLSATPQGLPDR